MSKTAIAYSELIVEVSDGRWRRVRAWEEFPASARWLAVGDRAPEQLLIESLSVPGTFTLIGAEQRIPPEPGVRVATETGETLRAPVPRRGAPSAEEQVVAL